MKYFWIIFFAAVFSISSSLTTAQELIVNSGITGYSLAGKKVNRIYIPPPAEFFKGLDSKAGGKINVIFTNVPSDVRIPVNYAVSILESLLSEDAGFTINVIWRNISTSDVLANSTITGFAGGWAIDALNPFAFYPVALAEKISGRSYNDDSQSDIDLVINSSVNWYLGTDGKTPVNRYDLVTVVLHELFHGIGFFDSMDTDEENTIGFYGIRSIPTIYDTFVENLLNKRLTDTLSFENYSQALYNELTGGQLYFDGPLVSRFLSGARVKLYAPSAWDPGSSVAHLDELRTLPENALMTPFIDLGEAIHNPGNLTMSIVGDMGWINTRIEHEKLKDTEERLTQIEITAKIKSDTLYDRNRVGVVYSFSNFAITDTIYMLQGPEPDYYMQTIPVSSYEVFLKYYLLAEDDFGRVYKSPAVGELSPHTIYIGKDTVKPVIEHTPLDFYFEKIDSIKFEAVITDNLAVDTCYVEYRVNEGNPRIIGLSLVNNDIYRNTLNVRPEMLKGGDLIQYRIFAVDKASSPNIKTQPADGYYSVRIEGLKQPLSSYSTDFSDASDDFYMFEFEIARPDNFTSYGLHSRHPYKSPEEDNKEFNFYAVLRHPILFKPTGMVISFREIALVEPGEEGSVFGLADFYDYVIIEGSKDYGKSWFALADGYDCRFIPSWETAYNSAISGMNSTYEGKESMLVSHSFYPRVSDRISSGDSVIIRFRLFSDPYANGWGWVIDDLKITPLVDQVDEISADDLIIYPNPGNGFVVLKNVGNNNSGLIRYKVVNLQGLNIADGYFKNNSDQYIDLTDYPSGIYLIILYYGDKVKSVRYTLLK